MIEARTGTRSTDAGLLLALADVLPELRRGLTPATSQLLTTALRSELAADAVAVVAGNVILAYEGVGNDHHLPGQPYRMALTGRALADGRAVVARGPRAIGCAVRTCQLTSGVAVPIRRSGHVIGALVLLRSEKRPISASARRGVEAMALFLGRYLDQLDSGNVGVPDLATASRPDRRAAIDARREGSDEQQTDSDHLSRTVVRTETERGSARTSLPSTRAARPFRGGHEDQGPAEQFEMTATRQKS